MSEELSKSLIEGIENIEDLDQEDVEHLSPINKIVYTLYWVLKCQSSSTWHHQRNENGCLGCINTVNYAIDELNALGRKLKDVALDFAKKHDEELNALKNRMLERP